MNQSEEAANSFLTRSTVVGIIITIHNSMKNLTFIIDHEIIIDKTKLKLSFYMNKIYFVKPLQITIHKTMLNVLFCVNNFLHGY